jgi:predicted nucleic acid-binding protein
VSAHVRPLDAAKAQEIELWVDRLSGSDQVIPMDGARFSEWARLMEGRPDRLVEDVMIAATARVHGLVVATRNQRDFDQLSVTVVNPFETES